MNRPDPAMSLVLDATTKELLVHLADKWGLTWEEAILRALEHMTAMSQESNIAQQAEELDEDRVKDRLRGLELDRRFLRYLKEHPAHKESETEDLNALWIKSTLFVRRLLKAKAQLTLSERLKAFKELQRSLQLTSAKAQEWQDAVRDARR
jgi:hypothetical protein